MNFNLFKIILSFWAWLLGPFPTSLALSAGLEPSINFPSITTIVARARNRVRVDRACKKTSEDVDNLKIEESVLRVAETVERFFKEWKDAPGPDSDGSDKFDEIEPDEFKINWVRGKCEPKEELKPLEQILKEKNLDKTDLAEIWLPEIESERAAKISTVLNKFGYSSDAEPEFVTRFSRESELNLEKDEPNMQLYSPFLIALRQKSAMVNQMTMNLQRMRVHSQNSSTTSTNNMLNFIGSQTKELVDLKLKTDKLEDQRRHRLFSAAELQRIETAEQALEAVSLQLGNLRLVLTSTLENQLLQSYSPSRVHISGLQLLGETLAEIELYQSSMLRLVLKDLENRRGGRMERADRKAKGLFVALLDDSEGSNCQLSTENQITIPERVKRTVIEKYLGPDSMFVDNNIKFVQFLKRDYPDDDYYTCDSKLAPVFSCREVRELFQELQEVHCADTNLATPNPQLEMLQRNRDRLLEQLILAEARIFVEEESGFFARGFSLVAKVRELIGTAKRELETLDESGEKGDSREQLQRLAAETNINVEEPSTVASSISGRLRKLNLKFMGERISKLPCSNCKRKSKSH